MWSYVAGLMVADVPRERSIFIFILIAQYLLNISFISPLTVEYDGKSSLQYVANS